MDERTTATSNAIEARARLFGFVLAGAEEEDCPSFAAALDEYVNAVTAIDTMVMEKADRECDEHIAAGREFRKLAERSQAWGQEHYDREKRYRARIDRVRAECDKLMAEVSGLSPVALAGRRDAVARVREAARPVDEETMMTTHPTDPPSTDRPPADPRLALLRALNTPPYDTAAGLRGTPLGEAAQLLDAYRAFVLRDAADSLDGLTQETAGADMAMPEGRWQAGLDTGIRMLRRMADGSGEPDAFRAAVLRDFLWRLEQSSGHDVAAKLIEDEPDLAELLNATEATT